MNLEIGNYYKFRISHSPDTIWFIGKYLGDSKVLSIKDSQNPHEEGIEFFYPFGNKKWNQIEAEDVSHVYNNPLAKALRGE